MLAPKGVPWREIDVSGRGILRSRARAKKPREPDTAHPMSTAIMSKTTTSSTSRRMPTPAIPRHVRSRQGEQRGTGFARIARRLKWKPATWAKGRYVEAGDDEDRRQHGSRDVVLGPVGLSARLADVSNPVNNRTP